jgi:hypothetical protein
MGDGFRSRCSILNNGEPEQIAATATCKNDWRPHRPAYARSAIGARSFRWSRRLVKPRVNPVGPWRIDDASRALRPKRVDEWLASKPVATIFSSPSWCWERWARQRIPQRPSVRATRFVCAFPTSRTGSASNPAGLSSAKAKAPFADAIITARGSRARTPSAMAKRASDRAAPVALRRRLFESSVRLTELVAGRFRHPDAAFPTAKSSKIRQAFGSRRHARDVHRPPAIRTSRSQPEAVAHAPR